MDVANEILDAIEIIVDKKTKEQTTQIYPGICKSVSGNSCVMSINGKDNTVQFYGSAPNVGAIYRVFVPYGNMSMAFIITTNGGGSSASGVSSVNGLTGDVNLTASDVGAAPVLKAGKTIYVSTTGRDDTGNGSESSPYATIQKAIDSLPKNLGGNTVTINVASGTYNAVSGSPIISATKFYNGLLDIRGPSSSDKAVLNGNISIYKCNATVRVLYLKAVGTDLWNGMQFQNGCIYIYDCQDVLINTCDIDGVDKSESGIFVSGQSNVGISNGDISNCDKAITTRSPNSSRGLATVNIYQMTGANNNVFIHSEAAVVSDYYKNTVEAATKYSKLGGIIIKPDGTVEGSAEKPKLLSVSLKASGWASSAKTQTTTVSGVLADETKQLITPTPALASQTAYYNAGIRCTGQSANKLTFTAKTIPTADLTVYVTIQEVGA